MLVERSIKLPLLLPDMTPEQALEILAQVASQTKATRADHELFGQAIRVIADAIKRKPE